MGLFIQREISDDMRIIANDYISSVVMLIEKELSNVEKVFNDIKSKKLVKGISNLRINLYAELNNFKADITALKSNQSEVVYNNKEDYWKCKEDLFEISTEQQYQKLKSRLKSTLGIKKMSSSVYRAYYGLTIYDEILSKVRLLIKPYCDGVDTMVMIRLFSDVLDSETFAGGKVEGL